jgi:hypothetical protein
MSGMVDQLTPSRTEFRLVMCDSKLSTQTPIAVFTVDEFKTFAIYKFDSKSGGQKSVPEYVLGGHSTPLKHEDPSHSAKSTTTISKSRSASPTHRGSMKWPSPPPPKKCQHCDRVYQMSGMTDAQGKRVPRHVLGNRLRCHEYSCSKNVKRRVRRKLSTPLNTDISVV